MTTRGAAYGTFRDNEKKEEEKKAASSDMRETLITLGLVALWYFLNTWYNIHNKKAVNMLNLPWTISTIQLWIGWLWFWPLWLTGGRKMPIINNWPAFWKKIAPQGVFHLGVHAGAAVSMAAGAVSFTHIVKAGEPAITALLAGVMLKEVFHPLTYLALVPVVGGVAVAAMKELSFTWLSFTGAMVSNLGSSLRSIFAKRVQKDTKEIGENLDSANLYSLLTIVSTLLSTVVALMIEGKEISGEWEKATAIDSGNTWQSIAWYTLLSGVWYYSYNEVAFITLGRLNAVTHAVANTLKRVVIILASVIVFRNPISLVGGIGSAIAVGGTLLYSLAKQKYH
ncbi:unnamed protein product [Vitrella brassicaformis CCMP3155]|uniref:Sugar phosphate transporter domain-containing protein n=1 Tax=Vitrella brassicaformis (strain CCMP3155) TaxID=1169540 RepID=A0A0G4EZF7_VITBC|nr:unnamed protein product [Vitrella brassicaformis CCMP3155]|eukprot:CEM04483.1 unnamed protein product [Vitrella brassicaformis CCMP3155]